MNISFIIQAIHRACLDNAQGIGMNSNIENLAKRGESRSEWHRNKNETKPMVRQGGNQRTLKLNVALKPGFRNAVQFPVWRSAVSGGAPLMET